jgi:NAD(P)-dependent dehydrogenase (short-subunit alcohol dehydrogenase family)
VSPGPIDTPIFTPEKLGITEAQLKDMGESTMQLVPMRRFGAPEEVAQVVAFLASKAASYVTGAQYSVGGGIEA